MRNGNGKGNGDENGKGKRRVEEKVELWSCGMKEELRVCVMEFLGRSMDGVAVQAALFGWCMYVCIYEYFLKGSRVNVSLTTESSISRPSHRQCSLHFSLAFLLVSTLSSTYSIICYDDDPFNNRTNSPAATPSSAESLQAANTKRSGLRIKKGFPPASFHKWWGS